MQTTLRIDDAIYQRAKAEAEREEITLTKFVEEALRLRLNTRHKTEGDANRADFLARLQRLTKQARERDRGKEGSAGPFSRKDLFSS
ncbi:MAG: hypothetical protein AB7G75_23625 [Candidatus Binatia bacterium]